MKKNSERSEVPIAAMIDVVFLLLVYFIMTSTQVVYEAYVQVNLPGPIEGPEVKPKDSFNVFVFEEHYEVMGNKYSLSEMDNYLSKSAQFLKGVPVNIKISKQANHQKLVRLLDSLNKVEISKFNLHTLR